jgi:hypothetical protein
MAVRFKDWTKPSYTTLEPAIVKRVAVEQKIARYTVKALLAQGYTLSVFDGEEITVKRSASAVEVCNAMSTTDEDYLYVHRANEQAHQRFGWVRFVYGNDGWDVICDYTTNLDPFMEEDVMKYAESQE